MFQMAALNAKPPSARNENAIAMDDDALLNECLADLAKAAPISPSKDTTHNGGDIRRRGVGSFNLAETATVASTSSIQQQQHQPNPNKRNISTIPSPSSAPLRPAKASRNDDNMDLDNDGIRSDGAGRESSLAPVRSEYDVDPDSNDIHTDGVDRNGGATPLRGDEDNDICDDNIHSHVVSRSDNATPFLRFYWLDAYENFVGHPGIVYLFGRLAENIDEGADGDAIPKGTKTPSQSATVSCCVILKGIRRKLYFLKRDADDKSVVPTDDVVAEEIRDRLERQRIKPREKRLKWAPVHKRLLCRESGVPREGDLIELQMEV